MNEFTVSILATDGDFYEGPCESLVVPTIDGFYGIQAGHSNMISAVVPGPLTFTIPGQAPQEAAVGNGLVKVIDGHALVMVETAERPEDIDLNRALQAAAAAKEAILQKRSMQEYRSAQGTLSRALTRLRVKNNSI